MTDPYILPNATHFEEGLTGVFRYADLVSDGLFIPGTLLALWVIAFIGTLGGTRLNASSAFIFSSFLLAIVSIPFAIIGLLGAKFMYLTGVLLAVGVAWIILEKAEGY